MKNSPILFNDLKKNQETKIILNQNKAVLKELNINPQLPFEIHSLDKIKGVTYKFKNYVKYPNKPNELG